MDDHLEMSGACPDAGMPTDNPRRVLPTSQGCVEACFHRAAPDVHPPTKSSGWDMSQMVTL